MRLNPYAALRALTITFSVFLFFGTIKKQESRGAYGRADKKSIKLRGNRYHTVQSNERCVFIFVS